jgi:Cu/Ag efflux pump CusA
VVRDVQAALAAIDFPLEHHPELLGGYAERLAAQRSLWGFVAAAVIGVFLTLQAAFRSWRLALLAFLALPTALAGGVLAAYLGGGAISIGSLAGLLAVLGLAARNIVLLISHYQRLEQHEGEGFGLGLVLRGTRERLAPILMTSLATALAVLPLALFGGAPGLELLQPMAVVILGGLVTSTLVTLFAVPAFYLWLKAQPELEFDFAPSAGWLGVPGRTVDASD